MNTLLKNGQTLVICKATPADSEEIVTLMNQIGGESDNLMFGQGEFGITPEQEALYLEALLTSENGALLKGQINGSIVATVSLSPVGRRPRVAHRGGISLSVSRACWGLGIGTAMLNAIIAEARQNTPFTQLELEVRVDNHAACLLYHKAGFQTVGIHPGFLQVGGHLADVYVMVLPLREEASL